MIETVCFSLFNGWLYFKVDDDQTHWNICFLTNYISSPPVISSILLSKRKWKIDKNTVSNKSNISDVLTKHRKITSPTSEIKILCHSIWYKLVVTKEKHKRQNVKNFMKVLWDWEFVVNNFVKILPNFTQI